MIASKMTVVFWSSTQKKSYPFANQSQFDNCHWVNFNNGDVVFDENGNAIGKVKAKNKTTVWRTDL